MTHSKPDEADRNWNDGISGKRRVWRTSDGRELVNGKHRAPPKDEAVTVEMIDTAYDLAFVRGARVSAEDLAEIYLAMKALDPTVKGVDAGLLKRTADHLRGWVEHDPMGATAETHSLIYLLDAALSTQPVHLSPFCDSSDEVQASRELLSEVKALIPFLEAHHYDTRKLSEAVSREEGRG